MSGLLHFAEHRLQEAALIFLALVYTKRILWLLKFPAGKERQAATGSPDTTKWKGILYSWAIIGMPWVMESSRTNPFFYAQFVIFHLGVTLAIALSFIIPYAPGVLENGTVVLVLQAAIWAACAVGCIRIVRGCAWTLRIASRRRSSGGRGTRRARARNGAPPARRGTPRWPEWSSAGGAWLRPAATSA